MATLVDFRVVSGKEGGTYIGSNASVATARLGIEAISNNSIGFYRFSISDLRTSAITNIGTTVLYNTGSDYRIKKNLTPLTNALQTLEQIRPVQFNYIEYPDTTLDGFVAHELKEVVPEAVFGEKDAQFEDGTPNYQQIGAGMLVPLLIGSLKEINERIQKIEAFLDSVGA